MKYWKHILLAAVVALPLLTACSVETIEADATGEETQWRRNSEVVTDPDTLALDSLDWGAINMPPEPNYAEESQWLIQEAQTGMAKADVFYVLPTYIITDYVQNFRTYGHMNTYDDNQRKEVTHEWNCARGAFGVTTNIYAPFYREMTLQSFISEETVAKRFPYALQDLKRAFNYYLEHYNQGRPFIIAGFSQGGKGTVELVKSLSPTLMRRLVCAYVIGYKVTPDDLLQYPDNLRPAQGSTDTGVTCCFSSVGDESSMWSIIQKPVACCINPITWSTGYEEVEVPGIVGVNEGPVTVRIHPEHRILFVSNYGTNDLGFYPATWVMGKQNYHTKEFVLYTSSIVQNVYDRVKAYMDGTTGIKPVWAK